LYEKTTLLCCSWEYCGTALGIDRFSTLVQEIFYVKPNL